MPSIEFRSLLKTFQQRMVVRDFTLRVEARERLVILGPSGCGKTTILRLLAGLAAPDQGAISIADRVVSADGNIFVEPAERDIGMVFQDLALWPHLTIEGNLRFGLDARSVPREVSRQRIKDVLQLVSLEQRRRAHPAELSGGEQQRLALARALVLQPQILLMDEPLSSLNLELSIHLRDEILRLQEEVGFTLIYVTHNREEAFAIGQRVLVMENGQIVRIGSPEQIREYLNQRAQSAAEAARDG